MKSACQAVLLLGAVVHNLGMRTKNSQHLTRELKRLGKDIKLRRKSLGFTQESLAEALEISSDVIQYVEQGRKPASLPTLIHIAAHLGLKVTLSS